MHCVCESLSMTYSSVPFRFGRKKVVFISLGAQCVSVLLQSFSRSWKMFCIMFLFVGASQISIYISAFVLGITTINNKYTSLDLSLFSFMLITKHVGFCLGQELRFWVKLCECFSQLSGPSFSIALGTWHYPGLHTASENGGLCLPFCPQLLWSTSHCGGTSLIILVLIYINIMCP